MRPLLLLLSHSVHGNHHTVSPSTPPGACPVVIHVLGQSQSVLQHLLLLHSVTYRLSCRVVLSTDCPVSMLFSPESFQSRDCHHDDILVSLSCCQNVFYQTHFIGSFSQDPCVQRWKVLTSSGQVLSLISSLVGVAAPTLGVLSDCFPERNSQHFFVVVVGVFFPSCNLLLIWKDRRNQ